MRPWSAKVIGPPVTLALVWPVVAANTTDKETLGIDVSNYRRRRGRRHFDADASLVPLPPRLHRPVWPYSATGGAGRSVVTMRTVQPLRRNRDFLLLWVGAAVSNLGSNASAVAYPLLVLALTGSPADAGLTGFVSMLPQLLFQLPAGALVDRINRKTLMIWCDVLRGLALGSIVLALMIDHLRLPQILVAGFIECTLTVFYRLAASAAVPNVVHPTQLTDAFSRNEARARGAQMLGQPLGGILFGLSRAVPFLFDAMTYVVSLVTLKLIRKEFQADRTTTRGVLSKEFVEGTVWLWRQPFLRMTTFLIAGSNLVFQALFLAIIVIARDNGASSPAVGLMLGIAAFGGTVGSLIAPWFQRRLSMRAIVIATNWAWTILVPAELLFSNPYLMGAIYALMSFIGPIWNVTISAYQLAITPDRIRGRVLGAASMITFGALPLGSLIGGVLLSRIGAGWTVAFLSFWMAFLAVAAIASPAVRHAPRLDSDRHPQRRNRPTGTDASTTTMQ